MGHAIRRIAAALLASALLLAHLGGASGQAPPGPAHWSSRQTWAPDAVNGGYLTGYFYWPATPPALAGKRALVLVLHGCKQTALGDVIDSARDAGYNWRPAADRYGAVIVAPNATGNVYDDHCWDWASLYHNRLWGHDGILLDLVGRFVGDPRFAIDPRQVYVAGLSAGGAETMVLGCLAPDVFAGIGIDAGPPPGIAIWQIEAVPPGYSALTAATACRTLAGLAAPWFATQVAGVIWGARDQRVTPDYAPLDAAAMRYAYGGVYTQGAATTVPSGGVNVPYLDSRGNVRTSEVLVAGMGHAWPAGPGGQNQNFVDATRVNYPAFIMDFWFRNNLRVDRGSTR